MATASKSEWAVITECKTRITHLEENIKELKEELKNHKKEGVETQRYISDRRLALYIGITSAVASFSGGFIVWLLQRIVP